MKRLSLFLAAGLLVVSTTGSATAAPMQFERWAVTCGGATVEVVARGVPGWNVELTPATTPMLLLGGHVYVYEGGALAYDADNAIPPGLAGRLVTCSVEGPLGVDPEIFHLEYDPAYILFAAG
jgi:hypothetical protein